MKDLHPLISFSFFVAVISLTMCASHPVLAALSLLVALAYLLILKGGRAALRLLGMSLLILAVITVFNAIFVHQGFTLVFYLFKNPVTLEAVQYGISLGCMLAAVLMWFQCYQAVVGSDRFLALFSWVIPVTTMMVSMIFNFIPQVLHKSQQINNAHKAFAYGEKTGPLPPGNVPQAATPAQAGRFGTVEPSDGPDWMRPSKGSSVLAKLNWPVRLSSILMGWSMETGLATAASMRARAYGSTRRTSYLPLYWTLRDGVMLVVTAVLLVIAIIGEYQVVQGFLFYPLMSALRVTWAYIPYVCFMAFPLVYEGGIRLKWQLSKF
ncbi:MAG: energy-coupling factor transporter transmembrane protein EcfT [Coriobacteriia bacterium]|nr:energy-coupling factor transporter transmembrane protein EcfT [Coriobacteriia bacterium]